SSHPPPEHLRGRCAVWCQPDMPSSARPHRCKEGWGMALEIVIEFPMSLGLAYHVAHHHRGHEVLQVLDAAERAGITAALQRLQCEGGYCLAPSAAASQRGPLQTQVPRHATSEDTLRAPHAHVLIASHAPDGAQVHRPAVVRAATSAQHAAVAAL